MKARKGKKAVCDLNAKFSQEDGYMETVLSRNYQGGSKSLIDELNR